MSQALNIDATLRENTGTGAARALRRSGSVPAIIYGAADPPLAVVFNARALWHVSRQSHFLTSMIVVNVGGKSIQALVRDVQRHVVTGKPLHLDLLRVTPTMELVVETPVIFINSDSCPGIKTGGVLNVIRRTLEVRCQVALIPDQIVIDLANVQSGQSIHISSVTLPDGVVPTITDRDFTVASITAPSGMTSEEETEADAAEEETSEEETEEQESS